MKSSIIAKKEKINELFLELSNERGIRFKVSLNMYSSGQFYYCVRFIYIANCVYIFE